jgi:8-oxo-dGTP diphosphatase
LKIPGKVMVGIGVVIINRDKILLGKRKGSHGAGEWSVPGGI